MRLLYQDYLGSLCEVSHDVFHAERSRFGSLQGRIDCLKILFQKILCLPFGLGLKLFVTFFRAIGVCIGVIGLFLGFLREEKAYAYFVERFVLFCRDIADWIALPFVLGFGAARLLLGSLIHPALYFR
jgi:hypothetical protein